MSAALHFNPIVLAAAGDEDINQLLAALATHVHLIDTPRPSVWDRRTPMHIAAENDNVLGIETLVRFGSKAIDARDRFNMTPIAYASKGGHAGALEALVRLGGRAIDVPDNKGCTPLAHAAEKGHLAVIETLLLCGSEAIDTPDKDFQVRPLHAAAHGGHLAVIETLLRHGSQALLAQSNGKTPLDFAVELRRVDCAKLLKAVDDQPTSPVVGTQLAFELMEGEVLRLRFPVYFAEPLLRRLLFALDRSCSIHSMGL